MSSQILLLHGAPGDARVWTPVLDRMPAGFDIRPITLSYFGGQPWSDDGRQFGTEIHCRDIVSYIEATMSPPVTIAAWSYSVHPALLTALERPDLVEALFFYEPSLTTYVDDTEDLALFAADAEHAFEPIARALATGGPEAAVAALIDSSGGEGCFAEMPEERQTIYRDSAEMMRLLMGGGQQPAAIEARDLARVDCPATVVLGERSRPIFAVPSRALAAALPAGGLEVVPGADHMLPEREPQRFATLFADWLAGAEGTI